MAAQTQTGNPNYSFVPYDIGDRVLQTRIVIMVWLVMCQEHSLLYLLLTWRKS